MYVLSDLADGLLTIYTRQTAGDPLIVNFTPRDVNGKLNVDGMISLGSFSDLDSAKEAAASRYPILPAREQGTAGFWRPFFSPQF